MKQVCTIVGAGPGVGLGVAQRFAREGFQVALVARRAEAVQGYAAELSAAGALAHGIAADVADAGSVAQAFQQIEALAGPTDVLVYNVAAIHVGPPSGLVAEDLVQDFRANVVGALLCAQQVIPAMRARGQGTILLTGGGLALYPSARYASLAIGKAGMRSLALTLAEELEPDGIHVATVTIAGQVKPDTRFAPDQIAAAFWQLHAQPQGAWEREVVYQ